MDSKSEVSLAFRVTVKTNLHIYRLKENPLRGRKFREAKMTNSFFSSQL